MKIPICSLLLLSAALAPPLRGASQPDIGRLRPAEMDYHWFSLPIEVRGLPTNAAAAPISCPIDFTALCEAMHVAGIVDEHSLRLFALDGGDGSAELPVQFSPLPQPRLKGGRLLPGTSKKVSYPGEYPAGETPDASRVAGQISWLAGPRPNPVRHCRLEFGIPRAGSSVQVPYPPANFRTFDSEHRASPIRWFPRMQIRPQQPLDGAVEIFDGQDLVTACHIGPTASEARSEDVSFRRPFLYPVNGLEGIPLTGFGKPHDPTGSHAHHYSLWIAHANVDGNDFWSERGGLIVHQQFEELEDGPVFCRVLQRNTWTIHGTNLLQERRQFKFYASTEEFRLIDVDLEFTTAGDAPVTFGQTTFGFLAVRVAQSMSVFDGGGEILNSHGDRNEQEAHLKRADWLDQSGPIGPGQWAGIALLDNPRNPNHPTGWHCRNDGWACASFNMDAPFTLQPGATLHLRYRIVLHRGGAVAGKVQQCYQEFAAQPVIQWGNPSPK